MTDIVTRLHQVQGDNKDARDAAAVIVRLAEELADVREDDALLRAEIEQMRAILQEMPDIIKDFDGGNPETATGWASEEMLDLWMRVRRALGPKP